MGRSQNFSARDAPAWHNRANQTIPALFGAEQTGALQHYRLFLHKRGSAAREVPLSDYAQPENGVHLSPDGHYAILSLLAENRPASWSRYRFAPSIRWITRYTLADRGSGDIKPVLDAPSLAGEPNVAWSADGRSVVLGSAFLPFDSEPARRGMPVDREMILAVRLSDRQVVPVTSEPLRVMAWYSERNQLILSAWDDQRVLYTPKRTVGSAWGPISIRSKVPRCTAYSASGALLSRTA